MTPLKKLGAQEDQDWLIRAGAIFLIGIGLLIFGLNY